MLGMPRILPLQTQVSSCHYKRKRTISMTIYNPKFMEKILLALIGVLLSALPANAQGWQTSIVKGDELKGNPEYTAYTYEDNGNGFIFWSLKDDSFRLHSGNGMFNYQNIRGTQGNHIVLGLVGFYDESGKLIDKIENFCIELDDEGTPNQAHPNRYTSKGGNNKKNTVKILKYLTNSKGSVRFVYELYGGKEFDLRVPCR